MVSLTTYVCLVTVVCLDVEGWKLDREKRSASVCSPINLCDFQEICANGGSCHRNDTTCGVFCVCEPGYTGIRCETELEDDISNNSTVNSTECEENECLTSSPCFNGGTCSWNDTSCTVSCRCVTGYSGETCNEGDIFNPFTPVNPGNQSCSFDLCLWSNPCLNGGTCVQNSDCKPKCECTSNVTGELCEFPATTSSISPTGSTVTTPAPPDPDDCGGGFMCYYGTCTHQDGGVTCDCDKHHVGYFCHIPCYRNCTDNGICDRFNATAPETCNCIYPYTGDYCEEVVTSPVIKVLAGDWKYWVVGSCLILLVLLALLLLLAYILMRRRNIFIMQVLYYFQPYEDDDGKQFDAFISYKSSPEDEKFVYHTLYPELEKKRGFKLCLHQRDFRVGETIANNILWAIESSRRTILVLSPEYMESDFTRFEYQIAHNEMLKQKHKVIPLLLEDFSHKKHLMDRTLLSILKSITYIEWPKESDEESLKKFWKRLELSLPKKKQDLASGSPESDPDSSYENSAFASTPIELEMISTENEDKSSKSNIQKSSEIEDVSSDVISDGKKNDTEGVYNKKPMNKKELKSFFDEPVNDDLFNKMKEKAVEYEQCLDV